MTRPHRPPGLGRDSEGWESLSEEGAEGVLSPNEELERALREATEAVEAREAERARPHGGGAGHGGPLADAGEVESLRGELAEKQDRLVRLQADFENFRRRTLKEREEAHSFGHQNLVKDLLPAVDNLERALEHARTSGREDLEALLQGIDLVQRDLMGVLAKHGVAEIEAKGMPFDPAWHEALAQVDDESVPLNTVTQVFQKGYRLRDRMLRPAQVVVSRGGVAGRVPGKSEDEE